MNDAVTSPCIDAGDPASAFSLEPAPNGGRVNMGYDGNTAYASRTPAPTVVSAAYVDTTHVNLLFSKTLNRSTAETLGNYAIASGPSAIPSRQQAARVTSRGIAGASKSKQPLGSKSAASVTGAALDADNRTVHLTTDVQAWSTTYTATVSGVTDTLGVAILTGSGDTASWLTPSPPPTVVGATYVDATHVSVLFSAALDPTTAAASGNYATAPSIAVSGRGTTGRHEDRAADDGGPGGEHDLHGHGHQRQGGRRGPDRVHRQHGDLDHAEPAADGRQRHLR